MTIITTNSELSALCDTLSKGSFFTIDTEFLRDKTYYPQLCLIQVAAPEGPAYAIDPLADGLDLDPLLTLLADEKIVKVFHAARQDLEIFFNIMKTIPKPLFDTQVAAMVCGYGDQIGYTNLVQRICGEQLDKGAQFTDWSRRPLSGRQISYALDDVTYLRQVYKHLSDALKRRGRLDWVNEEMGILSNPQTYTNDPMTSWQRIKLKSAKPKTLAVLRELCAWRETEAQRKNVPRSRVVRDETLVDIAVHTPETIDELVKIRGFSPDMARGKWGQPVIEAIQRGLNTPKENMPRIERRDSLPGDLTPVLEMLKMLLKIQCAEHDVASRLVADTDDLELLAVNDKADIPALHGWRFEVFGREALALKNGKITLGLKDNKICKSVSV